MSVAGSAAYKASRGNWSLDDPGSGGALPNDKTGVIELSTGGAETRTLANPTRSGLRLILAGTSITTSCTVGTQSTIGGEALATIALTNLDLIELGSFTDTNGAFKWQLLGGYGYVLDTGA